MIVPRLRALPVRARRWLALARRCALPLTVLGGLLAYAVVAPLGWAYADTADYRRTPADVPVTPVGLVLGAGIWGDHPSPLLARRLDLAADLYHRGKVKVLLVSGDNRVKGYDEPTIMQKYLVAHGVPEQKIVRDFAGLDTWDSCVRAKKIFQVDSLTVVTQKFHLPRAVALCRGAGLDAWGVGDDSWGPGREDATANGYAREPLAMLKALTDLTTHRDPKIGGRPEPGVKAALAGP